MSTQNRDHILNAIRQTTIARGSRNPHTVQQRLSVRQANIIPKRGRPDNQSIKLSFIEAAQAAGTHVTCLPSLQAVPFALARYLNEHAHEGTVRIATDPLMSTIPWQEEPELPVQSGPATGTDGAGLSLALAGIAETGTVLMISSPQTPAMLNILPVSHCVLLPVSRLVGNYEQTFDLIGDAMPRMATYITGPSRTADIEQKLLMGAHGPKRLFTMLIEDQ